ncbi:MAG: hypothetical protein IPP48_12045 [Chitinophagaceae bacterium]|nr:hypothetical protein [Chitinophagaceae bacterium]
MHEQWSKFIGAIASQARLVSTNRLSFEGNIINKDLSISNGSNITNNETLSGNMVIKASSLIEATEMAKECPVLAMGGSVEVRAILPMQP